MFLVVGVCRLLGYLVGNCVIIFMSLAIVNKFDNVELLGFVWVNKKKLKVISKSFRKLFSTKLMSSPSDKHPLSSHGEEQHLESIKDVEGRMASETLVMPTKRNTEHLIEETSAMDSTTALKSSKSRRRRNQPRQHFFDPEHLFHNLSPGNSMTSANMLSLLNNSFIESYHPANIAKTTSRGRPPNASRNTQSETRHSHDLKKSPTKPR